MKKPQMVATILVMVALLLIGAACGSDEASPETAGLSPLGPEQVAPASGEARDEADDPSSEQISSGMIIPRPNTIEDLVGQSHVIVLGTISSVVGEIRFGAYGEDGNPISAGEEPGTPYTDYEVRIESVLKGRSGVEDGGVLVLRMFGHLTLNPPKDTDGRREESGRGGEGATGEIAWVPFGVGRSADGLHRRTGPLWPSAGAAMHGMAREYAAGNSLGPGWHESAGIFGCPVGGSVADGAVRPGVEWLAAGPRRG